ncbi:MAG: sulfate adenylyltransferase [Deltaproteobacteria bacterium]|nr:MAG: sulfate adenylyltransferase [Deltaproteobacteria bacterium]
MAGTFTLSEKMLNEVKQKHGDQAEARLVAWQNLIQENGHLSAAEKLKKVNDFFNQVRFISDAVHWQQSDYWATPIEFLATNGGDCEDFSIAKYFTLKALGIEEEKLNLTYVKALSLNQAHMVVTYFEHPGSIPLVLDNLVPQVLSAEKRKDLLPIYSFNGTGIWLAKARGRREKIGSCKNLQHWNKVLRKMSIAMN